MSSRVSIEEGGPGLERRGHEALTTRCPGEASLHLVGKLEPKDALP